MSVVTLTWDSSQKRVLFLPNDWLDVGGFVTDQKPLKFHMKMFGLKTKPVWKPRNFGTDWKRQVTMRAEKWKVRVSERKKERKGLVSGAQQGGGGVSVRKGPIVLSVFSSICKRALISEDPRVPYLTTSFDTQPTCEGNRNKVTEKQ